MFSSDTEMATLAAEPQSVPSPAGRFYPLKVRAVNQETRDAITIVFDVPPELKEKFRFTQGQYLTLRAQIAGEDVRRSYSICSGTQEGLLRVAVKRTPGGIFSNWIVENVETGQHPRSNAARRPLSREALARAHQKLPRLCRRKRHYADSFHHQNHSVHRARQHLHSVLRQSRLQHHHVSRRAGRAERYLPGTLHVDPHHDARASGCRSLNGRIGGEKAEALLKQFCRFEEIDTIFLCGPQEMVDDVSARLKALGVPDARIKIELFTVKDSERKAARKISAAAHRAECEVTLVLDGAQHVFSMQKDTETVLDAALRRGIDVRHSCKSGVCATCRAKLVQGKVDMDANYALEDYEIARGFILTCQSYPITDQVTVDFDQDN